MLEYLLVLIRVILLITVTSVSLSVKENSYYEQEGI
jgi:hypothetical protein